MPKNQFNRDSMARSYAKRHLRTDPGIRAVYYLPTGAPEKEIRLIEVNELIVHREEDPLEPIDFGVDTGIATSHRLMILDLTPAQWEKVQKMKLRLPSGWALDDEVTPFTRS